MTGLGAQVTGWGHRQEWGLRGLPPGDKMANVCPVGLSQVTAQGPAGGVTRVTECCHPQGQLTWELRLISGRERWQGG